ncbi:NAD(P)-binding protein [Parathielavia hyrcaniae]|uniref:NAD(P)-binding protein n=1 Tax=Parathielavia hyrcaniae TaxID=113614 RepID=A0AAN6Q010_9PEZI|nr:NAD(P)-binding protein [Parathielavia hyrcaniae]
MTSNLDAASLFRVDGIVAVVTGGGTGIGLTMARALAINGAKRVYLLGRRPNVLAEATTLHPTVFAPIQCDVTSHASLQAAVDRITSETGYINLLIANSGISGPLEARWDPSLPLSEVRARLFSGQAAMDATTLTFHVNTTGALFSMVAFLELLDAGNKHATATAANVQMQGGQGQSVSTGSGVPSIQSQVIVVSSIAAYSRMAAVAPAYVGSKAAVLHLTKQASSCLAGYGIRANALAPGLFPTELASFMVRDRDPSTEAPDDPRFLPSRKFGGDEEMAGTLLYLASRAGAYCNGTVLMMDGGRLGVMRSSY